MPAAAPLDRARACLLGGALGDALGYPIEFLSAREIRERFGDEAPAELVVDDEGVAVVSDDTQMTLFTIEGLLEARGAGEVVPACFAAYRRWLATQTHGAGSPSRGALGLVDLPRLRVRRAPGMTCLDALASAAPDRPPGVAAPPNQSKGCGTIMRAAPFGLAALDRAQAFQLSRDAGALTHGHPAGYLPGAVFAALIWGLSRGEDLARALAEARVLLAEEPEAAETARAIDDGVALGAAGPPTAAALGAFGEREDEHGRPTRGGGWTGDAALGIALAVVLASPGPAGFAAALWRASAHDGDSDSTASLVGQLVATAHGPAVLPARWLADLELVPLLERAAAALVEHRT
jgi:ADP-ribosylglycohydrolase